EHGAARRRACLDRRRHGPRIGFRSRPAQRTRSPATKCGARAGRRRAFSPGLHQRACAMPATKKLEDNAEKLGDSAQKLGDSADRRTELAADRTVFAAERTYAAWVRTGLVALASGIGAKKLLAGLVPESMIVATGTL